MSEWLPTRLDALVNIKHGFAFKGEFFSDEPTENFLLTPGNFAIGGGFQWGKGKFYRGPIPEEFVLSPGDLLVTMTDLSKQADTLGFSALMPHSNHRLLHNQRLGKITLKSVRTTLSFIHWRLRSPDYRNEVLASSTGSTVKHTSPNKILAFDFLLPPIDEQEAIAEILSALDDKIELNRQTNETLEALARVIFKDWFVDFGPTRAKAEGRPPYLVPELWELFPDALDDEDKPVGWEMRSIYDFANVVYGAPFASKQFNTEQAGLPLIRIRDLATHEPGVCTEEKHSKGHLIEPGDIVVGMDGEFRLHVWKGPKSWLNQRVCHFEPLPGVPISFLVEALKEPLAYFERGKVGTTVIHLGKSDIDTFKLIHPGEKQLLAFSDLVEPLLEQCVTSTLESRTLAQTRDLILPKLMSGEIRLRETEKLVEAVA